VALNWATIGDSWAAGAAIKSSKRYDSTPCRRSKDAWGLQLFSDATWTTSPQNYSFAPCGEAQLQDLETQLQDVESPDLDMLTMIAGGNNCQVGPVVEACVYLGKSIGGWKKCEEAIEDARLYIEGNGTTGLEHDFREAVRGVLEGQDEKPNSDFRLYILGYAAFFAEAEAGDWCDDVAFSMGVKLEAWKRERMNGLIREVNGLIERVVGEFEKARFMNIDGVFEGHRFCEKGHDYQEQWYSENVWFWNLNNPADDPDYGDQFIGKSFVLPSKQSQATLQQPVKVEDLWTARIFHPKARAHTAIKNDLIAHFRADKLPGIKPTPSPPEIAPYENGTAIINLMEYWDCLDEYDNLSAEVWILDSSSIIIGQLNRTQAGVHAPIEMGSKFEEFIEITPLHDGDQGTVKFELGTLTWTSTDELDPDEPAKPWCVQVDWRAPACWRGEKLVVSRLV